MHVSPLRLTTIRATLASVALLLLLVAVPAGAAEPSADPPVVAAPYAAAGGDLAVQAGDRTFDALVRWPVAPGATAEDGPRGTGPWPVVVFGHGYLSSPDLYAETLTALAAHGFLVVAPRSGGELFPDHAAFAADLSAVIDWLTAEDARADGPFAGAVDLERIAVSGHSMGGGASILAAAADPRFRTVANLAAAETRPSAVAAAADITAPVLLIAGELDAIAPIAQHQRPIFEALTGAPAQLRTILGGSHCGFVDPEAGGPLGGLSSLVCDTGTIPPTEQQAITVRLLVDWLRAHLDGDTDLAATVWPADPADGTTADSRIP